MPCEQWQGGLKTANNLAAYTVWLHQNHGPHNQRLSRGYLPEVVMTWLLPFVVESAAES